VALASCESELFPYKVSSANAKGLFQLTPDLITDLNDKGKEFYSPVSNPFNIVENIAGGLSYFKYLNLYDFETRRLVSCIKSYREERK
jgi:soluble lytic murein transglycosylase-like protein